MLQQLHRTRRFEIFVRIPVMKQFLVPHLSFSVKVKFLELTQSFIDFQPRVVEQIKSTILHQIWIRFQGASMGAYLLYVLIDATQKTDSKISKMVDFICCTTLSGS